jgi:lipoprotein NlpD
MNRFFVLLAAAAVLAGCASSKQSAPVVERSGAAAKASIAAEAQRRKAAREKDWRPQVHIVEKGDTLYSIAFNYGFDYHELAELNGIQDPNLIQVGQQIKLFPGAARPAAAEVKPAGSPVKELPKVTKQAYSDAAQAGKEPAKQAAKPENKPEPKQESKADDSGNNAEEEVEWSMPAQGKLVGEFSESANRKGIDIAGKLGQPIYASAPGKVVYSGNGLRGYGKLVIIKHNPTYLSAYAHNDHVLVKEGQSVTRGQKIAEMGNTDADQVKLHFEVRRYGKPVDPAKYLPLGKS